MCGIVGYFSPSGFLLEEGIAILEDMRESLIHRGPDGHGIWVDHEVGIAVGHRRLSIIDLTPTGSQPMISKSSRYVLSFNGEIYNHLEIRKKLEASDQIQWNGESDTESLLTAIEHWGLERALNASVGMFAFALWDREARELKLVRDRMGEKPLFYGWQSGLLVFGSELKALRNHPAFESKIDQNVLPLFFRHGYIPEPWCVWKGIKKLLPGSFVTIRASDCNFYPEPHRYWSLYESALIGRSNPFLGSDRDAIDILETTLIQSIKSQMVADVPLGAFLSGGIDSSTIVALMQAQSKHPIKTFTIGFSEESYDEAKYAKKVANYLGTDHTELYISADKGIEIIHKIPGIYDEPFGDSSAIPTFLVSQLASQHISVSLSGDGGDELFCGYKRYLNSKEHALWKILKTTPTFGQEMITSIVRSKFPIYLNSILNRFGKSITIQSNIFENFLSSTSYSQYYLLKTSYWNPPPVLFGFDLLNYGYSTKELEVFSLYVEQMMLQDSVIYLPNDILTKVDRAGMAVSLECRIPFLDHRVVELSWRMPNYFKVRDGKGKWLLRQVLNRYIPAVITDRPKMGFGVPVDHWLRGPLKEWGEELIQPKKLEEQGFLNPISVNLCWREHQMGLNNWRDKLWVVLMWQAWLENNS
jgi:asparagine synthase (glutamine-hydrolysing)